MYQALKSFGGKVSMKKGDIKEINDVTIANDLLNAGYIKEVKQDVKNIETKVKEEIKKAEENIEPKIEEVKKTKKFKKEKIKKLLLFRQLPF